jgi:assimilatory nitrate reductase catalytic subunit
VKVTPYQAAWYGFALSRHRIHCDRARSQVFSCGEGMWHTSLAGDGLPGDVRQWAQGFFTAGQGEWIDYMDAKGGRFRAARLDGGRLMDCVFIAPAPAALPSRGWLAGLFGKDRLEPGERAGLLAGGPGNGAAAADAPLCACFGVGRNRIIAAVQNGAATPEAVGARLQAGTNCGSCVPEIRAIIAAVGAGNVEHTA